MTPMPDRNEDTSLGILYYGVEPLTSIPLIGSNSAEQEYAIVHPKRTPDPLVLFVYAVLILVASAASLLGIVWSTG